MEIREPHAHSMAEVDELVAQLRVISADDGDG